jgi:hypothetical protein
LSGQALDAISTQMELICSQMRTASADSHQHFSCLDLQAVV